MDDGLDKLHIEHIGLTVFKYLMRMECLKRERERVKWAIERKSEQVNALRRQ